MKCGLLLIVRRMKFTSRSAIDRDRREIVGCFVGDRTRKSARQLWASLPPVYQQCE